MLGDPFTKPEDEPSASLSTVVSNGDLNAIKTLLDQGADVNAPGGIYGNALTVAASRGKLDALRLLLDRGADVNATGGDFQTALQAAAFRGRLDAAHLLLEWGADVNAAGGAAIQCAARSGALDVIELLLDHGADINAQGGVYGTALQAAALHGKLNGIELLLSRGADVNGSSGEYGNALQAAADRGDLDVIELLLDRGADLDAPGGRHGNALQAAVVRGNSDIVKLLLDKGADVNAAGGFYGNSLRAAILNEHLDITVLLLDRGADVNAPQNEFGNYLKAASLICGKYPGDFIKLLLDSGIDVKARGAAALQISARRWDLDIVQSLLDRGADVNAKDNAYGTALQGAAYGANKEALDMIKLLLHAGADVNIQAGDFGNALQTAAYASLGELDIVELLLDNGADTNAHGGRYGTAIQAAACAPRENLDLIKLLLGRGADVNAPGGRHGSPLQAAASMGRHRTVKLLLDQGANVGLGTVDHQGSSLLHAAVACKDTTTLDLLLEKDAHVYINHTNSFKQTPLHVVIDHPESFQSFTSSLDLYLKRKNGDALTLFRSAINKEDADGCTPLHRAIENDFLEAAEWLIGHDASVEIQDFNNVAPFQRASQLKNFRMMSQIFPCLTKDLGTFDQSIKAADWRASIPSDWKDNIVLSLNPSKMLPVQAMDGRELAKHFSTLSYPLDYSMTSVAAHGDECIATAPFQRAIVGVYWRWWRKALTAQPEMPTMGTKNDRSNWRVQLNKIPSAVALGQPSRAECFLEGRVILPSCELVQTSTRLTASFLKVRPKNHAMIWILVKPDENRPKSTSAQSKLECKAIFTTLEYCEMSTSPTQLFRPCIEQLEDEWNSICRAAEDHLSTMRSETFRSNGRSIGLISDHLRDAQTWTDFKKLLQVQLSILRSLSRDFDQRNGQVLQEGSGTWGNDLKPKFMSDLANTETRITEKFLALKETSGELIELEFNLTSIAEAQKSTTMNRSMKRLSWITFIFLPLMFIASLFGMNIDILESNPAWWLYLPFAAGTIILTLSIWILFKTRIGVSSSKLYVSTIALHDRRNTQILTNTLSASWKIQ
ncbi:unnamed protein product [Penicillium olsonii]|nr:unnamed protein product [Penicillium olsonii]CAG7924317.1 unnamed protein product [Penicillium olsonii]